MSQAQLDDSNDSDEDEQAGDEGEAESSPTVQQPAEAPSTCRG